MALTSRLFAGDAALEACAVKDSAHLVEGARGDHVAKVQTALLIADRVHVDTRELRDKRYGPSTAAAVLSYKQKRSIINPAYQKHADNIVGKMTIAAMDAEICLAEKRRHELELRPYPHNYL